MSNTGKILTGNLKRNNPFDAGQDVVSAEQVVIPPNSSRLISTNLRINVPKDHVGLLWSRSGLSVKFNLEVGAGCIDFGYCGEVKVHLYNHGENYYRVNVGDRIAQLLTIPVNTQDYKQVDTFENTDRGENGFGSSGSK